jgi:hypothetical protein
MGYNVCSSIYQGMPAHIIGLAFQRLQLALYLSSQIPYRIKEYVRVQVLSRSGTMGLLGFTYLAEQYPTTPWALLAEEIAVKL